MEDYKYEAINKSYYAIFPANVRYDKDLKPNAKILYCEITALCNEKGYCWASNSYFAKLYDVSKETISRWIKQLIDKKYIYSEIKYKNGTKEIEYRYLKINDIPIDYPIDKKVNTYCQKGQEGIDKKVKTPIDEKVKDNIINNNIINNNNKKEKVKKKTSIDTLITDYSDDHKLQDALIEFVKMRKAIKKPLTDRGMTMLLNKLDALSNDNLTKIEILNQSIFYSWQGIFPLKEGTNNGNYGKPTRDIEKDKTKKKYNVKINNDDHILSDEEIRRAEQELL